MMFNIYIVISIVLLLITIENIFAYLPTIHHHKISIHKKIIGNTICKSLHAKKITPNQGESIEQYRKVTFFRMKYDHNRIYIF